MATRKVAQENCSHQHKLVDQRHLLLFSFFGDQEGYFGLSELEMKAEKREGTEEIAS